ncbi:hypothetical protein COOONC_25458 [Cooperia oncophora]
MLHYNVIRYLFREHGSTPIEMYSLHAQIISKPCLQTTRLKSTSENLRNVINVEASTLAALVKFCYSGKIMITEDNSLSILAAACYCFQLEEVQVCKTVKLIC